MATRMMISSQCGRRPERVIEYQAYIIPARLSKRIPKWSDGLSAVLPLISFMHSRI
jgi:hypothetical protein